MHTYIIYAFFLGLFFVFGVSQTFEGNMTGNNMEQFSPFQGNLVDTKQLSNLIATAMLHQASNFEKPYAICRAPLFMYPGEHHISRCLFVTVV